MMSVISDVQEHPYAIAIIGMAGRFPGARNLEEFRHNLEQGVESITFFSDEVLLQRGVEPQLLQNPNYVKAGSLLDDVEGFDASFFKYPPSEAVMMDPQHRIFLECAWESLEVAGYAGEAGNRAIGVFAGAGPVISSYLLSTFHEYQAAGSSPTRILVHNDKDYLSTRVSYKLNLRGPSLTVQTACSTSLVAVHLACQSLLNGECDMALAGGASIRFPHGVGYLYREGEMASPDGHCRAFDAQGQGTLFGSGVGIVVLKLLADAIADGDSIEAVIRGSAISNDGAEKISYWASSADGQVDAMATALAIAGVAPETIGYVETHGAATELGDPVEMFALTQAYQTERKQFCAIGSVKTNIGHTESAAGVAGLIKAVLSLKHKTIYKSLNFSKPNSRIDFENSPFYVNTQRKEWTEQSFPRRAAVNGLGIGGTNAFMILEEAPPIPDLPSQRQKERSHHLLTLSAKTPPALKALVERYAKHLVQHPEEPLADVGYTANTGRTHFDHRLALVASSVQAAAQQLAHFGQSVDERKESLLLMAGQVDASRRLRVAFLFTGQGSQYVTMGRELYATQPTFRQTLDRCDAILRPYLDKSLIEVLYPEERHHASDHSLLNQTAYTQPALFALEYALAELWQTWGIKPDVVMGHSVGELVAACVAGVFSLEDGLKLTAARGRLMQALPQNGSMVSLWASEAQVQKVIDEVLRPHESRKIAIAAINGPANVVLSGERAVVQEVVGMLDVLGMGIRSKELAVSHAFHSPLMDPILEEFRRIADEVAFATPNLTFISNLTGELTTDALATPGYWVEHVRKPVRFAAGIETLHKLDCDALLEIGPKAVLLGLAEQPFDKLRESGTQRLMLSSLHPKENDWSQMLASLGTLYVHGANVNWVDFDCDYPRRRVRLPTYPFERKRYSLASVAAPSRPTPSRFQMPMLHPLLGQRVPSPLRAIQFEGQISATAPAYLSTHRLRGDKEEGQPIFPASAYYEMALAAGAIVLRLSSETLALEDVHIQTPLLLPQEEAVTLQCILTPVGDATDRQYEFQIFSLMTPVEESGSSYAEAEWTRHALGMIKPSSVSVSHLYDQMANRTESPEQGQKDDSLPRVEVLWQGETRLQGTLHLPEAWLTTGYHLHPQILTTSLDLLDRLVDEAKKKHYVQVGVERMQIESPPKRQMRFDLELHGATDENQALQRADLRLYDLSGRTIASLTGIQIQQVTHSMLLGETAWHDWLYTPQWQPQPRFGHISGEMPTLPDVQGALEAQWPTTATVVDPATYQAAIGQLDRLSVIYIQAALHQMGWQAQAGQRFTTTQLADELQVSSHYYQLLQRLLTILADAGLIRGDGTSWEVDRWPFSASLHPVRLSEEIASAYPTLAAELALLTRCGANLALVLQGQIDPLELLFPDGDLSIMARLYRESGALHRAHTLAQQVATVIQQQLPRRRGLRILEIGAGTGSMTSYLLPHLDPERTEYLLTDIGAAFLPKAEERFKAYPFLQLATLDIEADPIGQGFDLYGYDVVIAANVLHATQDLRTTLQHVRRLLRAQGVLILVEVTTPQAWIDLVFGLTDGWWRFSDTTLRPDYPLISASEWITLLSEEGFEYPAALKDQWDTEQSSAFSSVIVAQAKKSLAESLDQSAFDEAEPKHWLILTRQGGVGEEICTQLKEQGDNCTLVYPARTYQHSSFVIQMTDSRADFQRLFAEIPPVHGVVHDWQSSSVDLERMSAAELDAAVTRSCRSGLHLAQTLIELSDKPPALWMVTYGSQPLPAESSQPVQVTQSPLWGLGRSIALEHPELRCTLIDLERKAADRAACLFEELWQADDEGDEGQIAFRDGQRYLARLARWQPDSEQALSFNEHSTYLITGGLGGIGLTVARWMIAQGARHLVLLSRRAPDDATQSQIEQLSPPNGQIVTAQADVSDATALAKVMRDIKTSMPPLRGVIHAAGIFEDRLLRDHEWGSFKSVFAPKVAGAWNLHRLTLHLPLDFFALFSAGAALIGLSGLSNYVAANTFLDGLAHYRRQQGLPALSINWGGWRQTGMAAAVSQQRIQQWDVSGTDRLDPDTALAALELLLESEGGQVGLIPINWPIFLSQQTNSQQRRFFAHFVESKKSKEYAATPQLQTKIIDFIQQLDTLPAHQRYEKLWLHVQQQLAGILGADLVDLPDWEHGFTDMGLDSLMALEFRNRLQTSLGCHLPSTLTFKYYKLDMLVDYLAQDVLQLSKPASPERVEELPTVPSSQAELVTEVEQLSAVEFDPSVAQELEELEALLRNGN